MNWETSLQAIEVLLAAASFTFALYVWWESRQRQKGGQDWPNEE